MYFRWLKHTSRVFIYCLIVFLPSGFFNIESYLNQQIAQQQISEQQLHFAHQQGLVASFLYSFENSQLGSVSWLRFAKKLAKQDNQIAVQLADYYFQHDDEHSALIWLKHSFQQGSEQAAQQLADYYFAKEDYQQAKHYLELVGKSASKNAGQDIEQGEDNLKRLIEIAVVEGDGSSYFPLVTKLKKLQHSKPFDEQGISTFLDQLARYQISAFLIESQLDEPKPKTAQHKYAQLNTFSSKKNCLREIQFIASSVNELRRADILIEKLKNTIVGGLFCYAAPKYVSEKTLSCKSQLADKPIKCNVANWTRFAMTIDSDYLAVITKQGKANVNGGVVYLDRQDDIEVITHEFAHLLGFVDEYALAKSHYACNQESPISFAHNLVKVPSAKINKILAQQKSAKSSQHWLRAQLINEIPWANFIEPSTPIWQQVAGQWQLGTPDAYRSKVGLFASNTCENSKQLSFKPVAKLTSLEYFERDFPQEYLAILQSKNKHQSKEVNGYLMPSFHLNISVALEQKQLQQQSQQWLLLAQANEQKHLASAARSSSVGSSE